jgi:hypothetical protein
MFAPVVRRLALALTALLMTATALLPPAVAAQSTPLPDLGSPAFAPVWGRTDYPVADGKAQRSYYFGPSAILSCQESYKESPGGQRLVTYLDKARMELSNPANGTVTAGLLAKELISGKMQVGDAEFRTFEPAPVPVAGDPGDTPAPTYASFAKVATLEGTQNRAQNRVGQTVTQTLNRAGEAGDDAALARYGVTLAEYRAELGHNIPDVFADFFARRGVIATIFVADGRITFTEDQQLIDWVQVLGLPIAEPYWSIVPVGGSSKWVLMQPYERRVITYTPDNSEAFRVEMGNIGQHYKAWRHPDGTCAERPAAPTGPTGDPVPDGKNATVNKKIGYWGTVFRVTVTGFTPNEPLSFWLTAPSGEVVGTPRPVNVEHPGRIQNFPVPTDQSFPVGVWAVTFQGDRSGNESIAYFRIVDRPPLPAQVEPTPPGKDATITPAAGWPGTVFRLAASGFTPNEPLSFWLSAPDGSTVGTPRPLNVQHGGAFRNFPVYSDEEFQPGVWAITFQGDRSGHQSIGYFRVVGG